VVLALICFLATGGSRGLRRATLGREADPEKASATSAPACEDWCASHTQVWSHKCNWVSASCTSCSQCLESAADSNDCGPQGIAAPIAGGTACCPVSCGYCRAVDSGCESRVDEPESWKRLCCAKTIEADAKRMSCADSAPPCIARSGASAKVETWLPSSGAKVESHSGMPPAEAQQPNSFSGASAKVKTWLPSSGAKVESHSGMPPAEAQQPNFLFFLVDDQPFDALGVNGRYPFLQTPNMDRLAAEGVLFDNFFATQSLCSPSRASFLTSTYPHIHGVNQNKNLDPNWEAVPPVSIHLQDAGFQTAFIGKIHMADFIGEAHIRPGFDYWYSFGGQGHYFDPSMNDNGKEYQEAGYMTDILTAKAVAWLEEERDPNRPFYLNLWHKGVHDPFSPAPRHKTLYAEDGLPTPPYDTHLETFAGKPEWQRIKAHDRFCHWSGCTGPDRYQPVASLPQMEWPIKETKLMSLLRCLKAIDESLGSVMAKLEELGELDNTIIIYGSDNGYMMGEHTFWDKRVAYENSMRIPMLIRYPQHIAANSNIEQICLNIDVAPTILDYAGVPIPEYMQGSSMRPLMEGKKADWRSSFMFEYYVDDDFPYAGPDMLAIRTDRYKLVDNDLEEDIDELYDLEKDPGEMNNLIALTEYDAVEDVLRQELEELKVQYGYTSDRDWWLRKVRQASNAIAMKGGPRKWAMAHAAAMSNSSRR